MKLLDLKMQNFRQFFGEQSITFAASGTDRNVTVIHGFNGAGKTALLNAFVWCLYGETTGDLTPPLGSERALAALPPGEQVTVSVRLTFEAHGETYVAERRFTAQKDAAGSSKESPSVLVLKKRSLTGEFEPLGSKGGAQSYIDQKLPPELYPFFFFNGERMEALAGPGAYDKVEVGVRTLLDVEIYDRSSRHLNVASRELSKELAQFATDELKEALIEQAGLDSTRLGFLDSVDIKRKNIAAAENELEEVDRQLSGLNEVRELIDERKFALAQEQSVRQQLASLRDDKARQLSRNGYLSFAKTLFTDVDNLVNSARQRGDLPAKVKPQFVDDLLAQGVCICGRPITDHEHKALIGWRRTTGLAELESAISAVGQDVKNLEGRCEEYFTDVDRLQAEMSILEADRRNLGDVLSALSSKIGDRDSSGEVAANLENRRERLKGTLREQELDLALIEKGKLPDIEEAIRELERKIAKMKSGNEKGEAIKRQIAAVQRLAVALNEIYEIKKQEVRADLSHSIAEIWQDAAVKTYKASIDRDFRLTLSRNVGGVEQPVHGASTGEKQVLALSFVGSLVKKAKANADEAKKATEAERELTVGGEYPLVMDSPFGALEPDYQRKVAEWVPKLAGQVVVLASKTNWPPNIEAAMRSRIGKEYILELHTQKDNGEKFIEIDGHFEPYVCVDNEPFERTIIREVTR